MGFATRFLDTVGDGSGNNSLNVNGSVTPVIFRAKPEPGQILWVSRLIFYLEDTGSIDSGGFGNGAALTNGLIFRFVYDVSAGNPDGTPYPDDYIPIKTNASWVKYCYDVGVSAFGQGNEVLGARYSFNRDVNNERDKLPFLAAARGEEFQLVVQDDLSAIVDITCRLGMFF